MRVYIYASRVNIKIGITDRDAGSRMQEHVGSKAAENYNVICETEHLNEQDARAIETALKTFAETSEEYTLQFGVELFSGDADALVAELLEELNRRQLGHVTPLDIALDPLPEKIKQMWEAQLRQAQDRINRPLIELQRSASSEEKANILIEQETLSEIESHATTLIEKRYHFLPNLLRGVSPIMPNRISAVASIIVKRLSEEQNLLIRTHGLQTVSFEVFCRSLFKSNSEHSAFLRIYENNNERLHELSSLVQTSPWFLAEEGDRRFKISTMLHEISKIVDDQTYYRLADFYAVDEPK